MLGSGGHQHVCQAFQCVSVHPLFSVCRLLLTGLVTWMSIISCCTFLVVHYASCLYYHGYDYYSGDCGIFWYVISFISYHGSLFNKLPATLGKHDGVLLPLLTLRCPGGVIGLASVPQQQPPFLMPP